MSIEEFLDKWDKNKLAAPFMKRDLEEIVRQEKERIMKFADKKALYYYEISEYEKESALRDLLESLIGQ